jgi:DNA-binding response OmpR family regulator
MFHGNLVLTVEDDPDDARLLQEAFADIQAEHSLVLLRDGRQAIQYLGAEGQDSARALHPFPGLLILDLQLPGLNGFEVLRWLRQHPHFKAAWRVVVLTSLIQADTLGKVKELGADELLEKPLGYEKLKEQLRAILKRWTEDRGPGRCAIKSG